MSLLFKGCAALASQSIEVIYESRTEPLKMKHFEIHVGGKLIFIAVGNDAETVANLFNAVTNGANHNG